MLITSFDEEGILDQSNLVLKSLTVLGHFVQTKILILKLDTIDIEKN
jgi:hypothetical protein